MYTQDDMWLEWFRREAEADQAEAEAAVFDQLMADAEEYGGEG